MLESLINPDKLMEIGVYVIAVNLILSGFYKGLEMIKDKTATQADNAIYKVLGDLTAILTSIADWIAPKTKK